MSTAQDILKKIEQQISDAKLDTELGKHGQVIEIKDGVATVSGLEHVKFSELVVFENGTQGLVLDLLKDMVGVLILGSPTGISQGEIVKPTGKVFTIGVGEQYLGRVVNALAQPIDGGAAITTSETYPVERVAPGVITRQ